MGYRRLSARGGSPLTLGNLGMHPSCIHHLRRCGDNLCARLSQPQPVRNILSMGVDVGDKVVVTKDSRAFDIQHIRDRVAMLLPVETSLKTESILMCARRRCQVSRLARDEVVRVARAVSGVDGSRNGEGPCTM